MKKIIIFLLIIIAIVACNNPSPSKIGVEESPKQEKKMSFREKNSPSAKYERMCETITFSAETEAKLDQMLKDAEWGFVNLRGMAHRDDSQGYVRYIFIIGCSNGHQGYGCAENCPHIDDGMYRKVRFVTLRDAGLAESDKIVRMEARSH